MLEIELLRDIATRLEERDAWHESIDVREKIVGLPDAGFWDRFSYARAVLYAGRLDEAKRLISALPDENRTAVLTLKADMQERAQDYAGAQQTWADAQQSGAQAYWCLFGRARAVFHLGELDEACRLMAEALALPERESRGVRFAASLDAVKDSAAGALVSLEIKENPALAEFSFDVLLKEMLRRMRGGEKIGSGEQQIAWAQDLEERLADQLDVHENRFSIRRLKDLFGSLYASVEIKPDIKQARFLDIGSGSHNPLAFGFLFIMLGASRAFAVDLEEMQEPQRALRAMARSADVLMTDAPRIVGNYSISHAEIERNLAGFDLGALRRGDMKGLDTSRLSLLRESASRLSFESASIDVITSNSFLEHVEDVEAVLAEMARITVRGGFGIHHIDGVDHASYWDTSLHPLEFLREPQPGMVNGSNRIRPLEFRALFEAHGFTIQQFTPFTRVTIDPAFRATLAQPWRDMPTDFLEIANANWIVRRL